MAGTTDEAPSSGLEVAIRTAGVADVWSREQVNLLLREYAAKGTTVDEFSAFLLIAKNVGLDPFTHEIWLPDFDGSGQNRAPYVGRDGLLAVAERSGQFDGMVSGVVYHGDEFELGLQEPTHRMAPEDGRIRFAYAYVYRKDRRYPTRFVAKRATFLDPKVLDDKGNPRTGGVTKTPWFRFPDLMLKKVAEANALRLAFRVSGVIAVADNATPIDAADVVEGEVIELPDEPATDPHARGTRPAQNGAPGPDIQAAAHREPEPPVSGPGPDATTGGQPPVGDTAVTGSADTSGEPVREAAANDHAQAALEDIGVAPLAGHPVDGDALKRLVAAAKPMKRADLARVARWATRGDSWPAMSLSELDAHRAAEITAFLEGGGERAIEALSSRVVDWELEQEAARAGDDDEPRPEQGRLA